MTHALSFVAGAVAAVLAVTVGLAWRYREAVKR